MDTPTQNMLEPLERIAGAQFNGVELLTAKLILMEKVTSGVHLRTLDFVKKDIPHDKYVKAIDMFQKSERMSTSICAEIGRYLVGQERYNQILSWVYEHESEF